MNISSLKGRASIGVLAIVVASLVVTMLFFHLFALIGIAFVGMICYTFDYTVGVRIHRKRQPDPLPNEYKEQGLFIYKRLMWTRIKFVFWASLIWFGIGLVTGKLGLGDLLELPAQMTAFLVGLLLGPLASRVWANRHTLAAKADKLETDLSEGKLDPIEMATSAARRAGASVIGLAAEVTKLADDGHTSPPPFAESNPPAEQPVVGQPSSSEPQAPVQTPKFETPDDVIERFVRS